MHVNKIIKYKNEVNKNLSFDYTQFINKYLIEKINFKITVTQKQLVKYCHQILSVFFSCSLIMYVMVLIMDWLQKQIQPDELYEKWDKP